MRNPFRRPEAASTDIEDNVRQLLSPLAGQRPSPEATSNARQALRSAVSAPAPVHGLGFARRLALGGAALVGPLLAVTAVGALTGQEQLSAPLNLVSSAAGQLGVGGNSGDHRQDAEHRDTNAGTSGQPGWTPPARKGGGVSSLAATNATPSTTPTGGSQNSQGPANDPHANGKGCDDVNQAVATQAGTPGGPQGCEVGKSAEHRKNGQEKSQTGQKGGESSETSQTGQKPDPHNNGNGCDDVNHAGGTHTPTPGGPQGCEVGSSGEHRKNGENGQSGSAAPSSTPAAGTNGIAGPTQAAGGQGGGNQGNGGPGGQGNNNQGSGNQGNGKGPRK